MVLASLIDKQDSFEIVRDQIAGILRTELLNQQALAVTAAEDPLDWTMDVYIERDFPIEKWLNAAPQLTADTVPSVSISIEIATRSDKSSSVPAGKQVYQVTYLIDVLARGVMADDPGGGHISADHAAHVNCQAAVRLVRNILSATIYRRLNLPTVVWGHPHFASFEYGQAPVEDPRADISVWNGRGRFLVTMIEFSPEFTADTLELIRIDVSDHGGVILSTEIDTTP